MDPQDRYVMLLSSLPASERLFLAKQPPISRIKLERRLRVLSEEDAHTLAQVEAILNWGGLPMDTLDTDILAKAEAALQHIESGTLQLIVRHRLEMRTIIAALRRRKQGEGAPAHGAVWGFGRVTSHIARNWTDPGFRLGPGFPWVRKAAQLLDDEDAVGFERLVLESAHRDLHRHDARHHFDFEAVVIYVLKWSIFDRWARAKAEDASKRFENLVAAGLGARAVLTFEGEA